MVEPKIRFPEYCNDWKKTTIGEAGTFYYGHSCPKWSVSKDATTPCVRYGEMYTKFGDKIDKVYSYTNMPTENLRFSKGTEVLVPRVGEDKNDLNHCTWLSLPNVAIGEMISVYNTSNNPHFTAQMFNATLKNKFQQLAEGGSVINLYYEKLTGVNVFFPTLEEQQKIANFLSDVDEIIAQSEAEVTALEKQKKGAMQKIFSQEVRFKKDNGSGYPEWEEKSMKEIFKEIVDKNHPNMSVLSISQGVGTILRDSSDRRIAYDKSNLSSYKAIKKGDFIIHMRTFEGGLECATMDGITSPAYKILRTSILIPEAFRGYFRSHKFISGKLSVSVMGIRDGKSIDMPTFWEISIPVPCLEEQQKIADFLSSFDEAIDLAKQELEKWKLLKKGLLQQMFV